MRVAVLGAGSLGTIIGAFIAKGGENVELIDVNQAHVDALNKFGAKIVGTTECTIPVKAVTPKQMSGTYDLVLLLTKQLYNQSVISELLPFLNETSVVCSLQNGIPEGNIVSLVGKERVVGGSVEFGATWVEPGVSKLTTNFDTFKEQAFAIGELDGSMTERIQNIKSVLDHVGGTVISDNLVGIKWSKLMVNVALSGMSAALGGTYGDVLDNEFGVMSAVHLADETIKVGHSKGIKFARMGGFDISSLEIKNESDIADRMNAFRTIFKPQALLKASMLQDLEKQRETEIDYINGIVPNQAKYSRILTPYNDLVVKLVKQAEETKNIPNFGLNIQSFKQLIENNN
ncbi:ketopantoate reductase family protein [Bacillus mycoides]|uniref:ketopantoate reductase family protein n=1 Tax=Bacillus mycoides TaxID=1405 RepID=UPI0024AE4426|nr:ketopantoate reductase family protein [Bacillus mycoides]MDI6531059.1 ketopantoate reductase family protein [Bacillus mycoides]WJE56458.1 ketopantoate reductase family protein [Bacillus mycoides]WJE62304.1 ketopantoate reductase family protein [Bacillus mycoides]WJE74712.1 ketopantoate reductase family protein [Bacillus mycoides]